MEAQEFQVIVDSDLGKTVGGVLAFGDFELTEGDDCGVVYPLDTGLVSFYEDMLRGRPFPTTLAIRDIQTVGQLIQVTLFLHRDLVLRPRMPELVTSVGMVDRFGLVGLAHIDDELGRFFKLLSGYLPPHLKKNQQQERLTTAVGWVREYVLGGDFPALPAPIQPPRVIDTGTSNFVVAEAATRSLRDAWLWLYRQGFLWGLVFSKPSRERRKVLGARKSPFVPLVLPTVAANLNKAEAAMSESTDWGNDELWLYGPETGTLLPIEGVTRLFIHV